MRVWIELLTRLPPATFEHATSCSVVVMLSTTSNVVQIGWNPVVSIVFVWSRILASKLPYEVRYDTTFPSTSVTTYTGKYCVARKSSEYELSLLLM